MKTKFLANLTNICETKYTKCSTWLDHISQDELAVKLEYIKSLLEKVKSEIPANQKKRKWFKADSVRDSIDTLEVTLKEVDNKLGKLNATIDQILARPRCPSSAVSEIDYPLPSKVTDVAAKPEGRYMVVSWKDDANSADSIQHYSIYVDDNVRDVYDPSTSSSTSIDSKEHSARLRSTFDACACILLVSLQ